MLFVVSSHQVRCLSCFRCCFLGHFDDNAFLAAVLRFFVNSSPGLVIFFMHKLMNAIENWATKIGKKNLVFKLRKHLLT